MPFFTMMAGTLEDIFRLEAFDQKGIELGTELVRVILPATVPQQNVDMAGYVSPNVSLPEGRAVVPVIDKIAGVVVKVISEFEALFQPLSSSSKDGSTSPEKG